ASRPMTYLLTVSQSVLAYLSLQPLRTHCLLPRPALSQARTVVGVAPCSLPIAPSALAGLLQVPVAELQVPAVWHWSEAVHTTGFVPTQAARRQVSVRVQPLPSLQAAPSGLAGLLQVPVAGLQVPAAWHWSEAVHTTGFVPTQAPARQVSVCVQPLPSLQGAPSALAGLLQVPVAGLQVPASEQRGEGVQTS